MNDPSQRAKWDQRHREAGGPRPPARVLVENPHLLPRTGQALDVACGLGSNAMLLARQGLAVWAWDFSPVAIERLQALSGEEHLAVTGQVRDVVAEPPEPCSFDVIMVAHFLERSLFPSLMAALRPGGLLYYQTFTRHRLTSRGPPDDAFRLAENELLALCGELTVRVYREEGLVGDTSHGLREEAMIVAQRKVAE